jgi:hypothetical protein
MKKIALTLILFFGLLGASKAQILFNTAQTLNRGNWSLGLDAAYADYGQDDFALFIHGGYGLGNNSDLGLKLGFGWGDAYIGLDYEKTLLSGKPSVSLHGGAHYFHDFGLDFGATVSFPIGNVWLSTGLDMDLNFGRDAHDDFELYAPLWLPINLEVYLKKNFSIVFEGNIRLTDAAYTTVGGGINVYF